MYFVAAPTQSQCKRIYWGDLKKMIHPSYIKRVWEVDLKIRLIWDVEICLFGLDEPSRIEGTPWDGCVIDELANIKKGVWDSNVRPALSDRQGWAWLIGVPDIIGPGQADYRGMADVAVTGKDSEWALFNWPSADILDPSEVASAKRRMDPRMFKQEYMGEFILQGSAAFPDFSYDVHVGKESIPYDPSLPLCWSLDFNVDPLCSGLIQHHDGEVKIIHEFQLPNTRTDGACDALVNYANENSISLDDLTIYGDASGNSRRSSSVSGETDWKIVRNLLQRWQPRFKVPPANPMIKDTINAVNARLLTADGATHLIIDPSCTRLIRDFRDAVWPGDMEENHAIAWLRYFCEREYPIRTHHMVDDADVVVARG